MFILSWIQLFDSHLWYASGGMTFHCASSWGCRLPLIECFIYSLHRIFTHIYTRILMNFDILQSQCKVGWIFSNATCVVFIARSLHVQSTATVWFRLTITSFISICPCLEDYIKGRNFLILKAFWSCINFHNSVTHCPGPHITRN